LKPREKLPVSEETFDRGKGKNTPTQSSPNRMEEKRQNATCERRGGLSRPLRKAWKLECKEVKKDRQKVVS